MATTDARTGFRLPWSADSHSQTDDEATPADVAADATTDDTTGQPTADAAATEGNDTMSESTAAADPVAPAPASKRPNKFLADLTRAMQAAAESAREESVTRLQADAKGHIEAIHERSATEAADLRRKADDDVAAIREWSKAEIARIREETDGKISARKGNLEFEIEQHAARIERQIEHVHGRVSSFEQEMAAFFERLLAEEDPTRFAALAENLPEPPPFDLDELAASTLLDVQASAADSATTSDPAGEMDAEAAMGAIQASAEAVGWTQLNEAEAAAAAEPVEGTAATRAVDSTDPRLSALGMSADFAAAEAEAFEAAGAAGDAEDIPLIENDALAARLAGLVPDQVGDAADGIVTTQVVVTGLVSVASIASFKRHLGRLPGVQSVGVSSGPEGEFIFAVSHGTEVVIRDSVATLPGFQARVTGGTDTTVEVSAHDPESDN